MWPLIAGVRLPPCGKDTPQTTHVGAWFHWLYWHIAEPLADTENPLGQQDEDEVESRDELPELPPSFETCDMSSLPSRHLSPGFGKP